MEKSRPFHAQQVRIFACLKNSNLPKRLYSNIMNKTALTERFVSGKVIMKSEGNTGN